jgi:hypothetical protein
VIEVGGDRVSIKFDIEGDNFKVQSRQVVYAQKSCRYLLHDDDAKYSAAFCSIIETARVKTLALPARVPI